MGSGVGGSVVQGVFARGEVETETVDSRIKSVVRSATGATVPNMCCSDMNTAVVDNLGSWVSTWGRTKVGQAT